MDWTRGLYHLPPDGLGGLRGRRTAKKRRFVNCGVDTFAGAGPGERARGFDTREGRSEQIWLAQHELGNNQAVPRDVSEKSKRSLAGDRKSGLYSASKAQPRRVAAPSMHSGHLETTVPRMPYSNFRDRVSRTPGSSRESGGARVSSSAGVALG